MNWYADLVHAITRRIERACYAVDGFEARAFGIAVTVPEGYEFVWQSFANWRDFYAAPSAARVFRLWCHGQWAIFPVRMLYRAGFIRSDLSAYNTFRWSYPFRPRDLRGYALPWECRVLDYLNRRKLRRYA